MKFSSRLFLNPSIAPDVDDEAGGPSCYFSNGEVAEGYHTCDVKSPVASCCPPGYACSGDALCTLSSSSLEQPDVAPGTVSRDACTEPRWNGDSCGSNCSDSEDATGGGECDPVGGGRGDQSCCAGGNAPGGCICSSNVAGPTLAGEADAQNMLGRRTASLPTITATTAYQIGGRDARFRHASRTVSPDIVSTEAGSSDMSPGYSSWARTSSTVASVPVITPVTPPTWTGAQSETTEGSMVKPSQSDPSSASALPPSETPTPIITTISIMASSLTRSSSPSSLSSSQASISPSVPTVIPIFPDGASSEASSSEATTSSLATKLGLGLGIPLVVLAVALLTAFVYRRQRRLRYEQAPPFDFSAPEMAPVSAADFAPHTAGAVGAAYHDAHHNHHHHSAQGYRRGPRQRPASPWSEWGTGIAPGAGGGAWTGTQAAAWRGSASHGPYYDNNQIYFVDSPPGHQEAGFYYNNNNTTNHGAAHEPSSPVPSPARPPSWQRFEDLRSPYDDRGPPHDTYQVPVVQVHQPPPQWTPTSPMLQVPGRDAAEHYDDRGRGQGQGQGRGSFEYGQPPPHPQRDLARVSRGGLSVNEEVSPLSSTGSGVPYPRMSAISGMGGWETNQRMSRG